MVIGAYSCKRMTAPWLLVIFHNIIDVSSYNAFVIWREINPTWMSHKSHKRRVEQLGKALSDGLLDRPDDQASTSTFKASKRKRCQLCPKEKDNRRIIHVLNAINTDAKAVPYHTVHHVLNRSLWTEASHSTDASEYMEEVSDKKQILTTVTRWNSYYDAYTHIIEIHLLYGWVGKAQACGQRRRVIGAGRGDRAQGVMELAFAQRELGDKADRVVMELACEQWEWVNKELGDRGQVGKERGLEHELVESLSLDSMCNGFLVRQRCPMPAPTTMRFLDGGVDGSAMSHVGWYFDGGIDQRRQEPNRPERAMNAC
ncbi:unnamed protein product [Lepeophtheirus salmonis]|uniref:(salmon louse) hypothetical protein n=1 Tax=Lepeophtheirus salmonis TaxID=72036 RepID=A0A817FDB8_LEPSM|nr:unnamed protein product [Lepeophtheirus salmonis]CAG9477635.1 unnamed protein product [Lepeophtheirus salmonis]